MTRHRAVIPLVDTDHFDRQSRGRNDWFQPKQVIIELQGQGRRRRIVTSVRSQRHDGEAPIILDLSYGDWQLVMEQTLKLIAEARAETR